MVTQQSGSWGISVYFDPSDAVNFLAGSMTKSWEVRFTFTVTPFTIISTPVGTSSDAPVTYFISFVGYTEGQPISAMITDVETRGDLNGEPLSPPDSKYIDLRVSAIFHFNTVQTNYRFKFDF